MEDYLLNPQPHHSLYQCDAPTAHDGAPILPFLWHFLWELERLKCSWLMLWTLLVFSLTKF